MSDLKLALRSLLKTPGFAAVAILSLALAIGANTAVFSLINAVLFAQLPVKNPRELIIFNWLAEENAWPQWSSGWEALDPGTNKSTGTSFSIPAFEAFRQSAGTLSEVFAFAPMNSLKVVVDGTAEIVTHGQVVSGNYHRGLGIAAAAGRLLTPEDDLPAAEPAAVISFSYWQQRFGGDADVLGKAITVNDSPFTIVGVTPPAFKGAMQVGEAVDITLPIAHGQRVSGPPGDSRHPGYWWVRIMGRLKPGMTAEHACVALQGLFQETARGTLSMRTLPGTPAVDPEKVPPPQLRAEPGGQGLYEARLNYEKSLRLLMGMVAVVLLVACANVANLLLARGESRRREIAVQLALGASRARLVRQLLAESLLLAALGCAMGLLLALWGIPVLVGMWPFGAGPLQLDPSIDWRVLGFTVAVAIATGIAFGLVPALRATRLDLVAEFQGGMRSFGAGPRSRLAKSLMVAQVALSLVLLVSAGLFVRTLRNLKTLDVGFNRGQLLLFQVNAVSNGASAPEAIVTYDRLRARLAALPGVHHVSYGAVAPLSQSGWRTEITVPGYVQTTVDENVRMNAVESSYLTTLEMPLLRGRDFDAREAAPNGPKAAIVNQSFAEKYFGGENVIGRRFNATRLMDPATDIEIVGLVHDAHYSNVRALPGPVVFLPYRQLRPDDVRAAHFVVRFSGSDTASADAVRAAAREIDATLPLVNVRTQEEQIDRLLTQERFFANLCSFSGLLALGLAAIGLYGLMSYAVLRRTGEIGLRMALGARPESVRRMVVRESLALVFAGIAIGLATSFGTTRWITSRLYGLSPNDPATHAVVALILLVVAILACWIPARRAARVDPMTALRAE